MIKRKTYRWGLIVLVFIVIVNISPINFYFSVIIGDKSLKFSDYHFSGGIPNGFSYWLDNDGINGVEKRFNNYREHYPKDSVLYRNFSIQPWKFWRWSEYATSHLYKFPCKEISTEWTQLESGVDLDSLGKPLD